MTHKVTTIIKDKKIEEIFEYIVNYVYHQGFSDGCDEKPQYRDDDEMVKLMKEELKENFNIEFHA